MALSLLVIARGSGFLKKFFLPLIQAFALLFLLSSPAWAAKKASYSLQFHALAPNAGGQRAFALRRATDEREWSVFANEYLRAGDNPLIGGLYSFRYPICGQECLVQVYAQTGVGVTSVGPAVEFLWGMNLFWTVRLDVASQFYFTMNRVVLWSYPLWIGLSVSL